MPTVSVIVPNYNHARFLPQRIESILRQTYQDFELILLDDCSTDDSRAVLSQYASEPRVRIQFNEVNSGSTFRQWNKGVRLARGKYVWIAESDDYADERLLERLRLSWTQIRRRHSRTAGRGAFPKAASDPDLPIPTWSTWIHTVGRPTLAPTAAKNAGIILYL